jgi:hypothetical protein
MQKALEGQEMNTTIGPESLTGIELLGDLKVDEAIILNGSSRYLKILLERK